MFFIMYTLLYPKNILRFFVFITGGKNMADVTIMGRSA